MKTKKLSKQLLILAVITLVWGGCHIPAGTSYFNISSSYEEQVKSFDLKFCAYNVSEMQDQIFYKFNTSALLFVKHKKKDYFFANYQVRYEIYDNNVPKTLVDSATLNYTDSTDFNSPKIIVDSFMINLGKQSSYTVTYVFTDLNKNVAINGFLNIDKSNIFNRNNFVIKDLNDVPLIDNFIDKNQAFKILTNNKQIEKLYVSYYKQEFPLAEPPYSLNTTTARQIFKDSLFVVDLHQGETSNIVLNAQGIYFFQTDTSQREGLAMYRFYNGFPLVTSAIQMVQPLQYITTKQEFNDLKNAKSVKEAIDNFWMERTGDPNRAKELIKVFYNRVQKANLLFTSYKEGWKTDRGMIYLVMGPPLKVYRSKTNETWYFGEDRTMASVIMVFSKTTDRFSDNDYTLERGVEFKDTWYNGVESWRK